MKTLFISSLAIIIFLTGCMAMVHGTADQLSMISIGMTKDEVIKILGTPKSVAADQGIEYLQYHWVKTVIATDANWPDGYFVALKEGKVASFGKRGDFDSTKTMVQRIAIDQTVRDVSPPNQTKDLYTELKKLKDLKDSGIINESEFEAQKKKFLEQAK